MSDSTISDHLRDWNSFCTAYRDMIQDILASGSIRGVRQDQVDDLTHEFLIKFAKPGRLQMIPVSRKTFRNWLFKSLKNHVYDWFRKQQRNHSVPLPDGLEPPSIEEENTFDSDVEYALYIEYLTLQKLRVHCEATGKPEIWRIFSELTLTETTEPDSISPEERREQLLREFPGKDEQFLYNRLTTANRIIRRILPEVIPHDLTDAEKLEERMQEWAAIIRGSLTSQKNLKRYRLIRQVPPIPNNVDLSDFSSRSLALLPNNLNGSVDENTLSDDELEILLSFRLRMPLDVFLGGGSKSRSGSGRSSHIKKIYQLSVFDLVEQSGDSSNLPRADLLELLARIKRVAKWNHAKPHPGLPAEISILVYTLANTLAVHRCNERIGSITDKQLAKNIRWSLDRPWVDSRLRPVLESTLSQIGQRIRPL